MNCLREDLRRKWHDLDLDKVTVAYTNTVYIQNNEEFDLSAYFKPKWVAKITFP